MTPTSSEGPARRGGASPGGAENRRVLGWREWVALPELGIPAIKAKLDTGARTSAIHAHNVRIFRRRGAEWVRFRVYPLQGRQVPEISCEAPVSDERTITDSGGHREKRIVIRTVLLVGDIRQAIEMTITRRDTMRFRMLLGRTAMAGLFAVDPQASFKLGRGLRQAYRGLSNGNSKARNSRTDS